VFILDPFATLSSAVAEAMNRAVDAAALFRGATAPNPPVGCTLLDDSGSILAVEAHRRAGGPHAEAAAIAFCRDTGTLDRIRTVVVTLEPCNHWGRTPPCTEAILSTPAASVVIGAADPNSMVAGGGLARLRAAGLAVCDLGDMPDGGAVALAARCSDLIAPFAKRAATGRPWVTVKQALDPSGSMIPPPGAKTFTSPAALRYAHALRRRADAVLTGSGTVLADDPDFTVRRVPDHPGRQRQLAILDRRHRVPARYMEAAAERRLVAFTADDLGAALDRLAAAGALEVLVEAGPAVTGSVLDGDAWDEHVLILKSATPGAPDRAEVRRRGGGVATLDLA